MLITKKTSFLYNKIKQTNKIVLLIKMKTIGVISKRIHTDTVNLILTFFLSLHG